MAMKKSVKKKWVAALRSGKYKQGKHTLRTEKDEFCCLGVLCEVARQEGVIPNPRRMSDDFTGSTYWFYGKGSKDERRAGVLPDEVMGWAGLADPNPVIKRQSASYWNDSQDKSFEEIADLIEEYL